MNRTILALGLGLAVAVGACSRKAPPPPPPPSTSSSPSVGGDAGGGLAGSAGSTGAGSAGSTAAGSAGSTAAGSAGSAGSATRVAIYADPKHPVDYVDGRTVGSGKTFMVVSEHPLASQIGKDVIASGGNAVDAAIAVHFALAVVHPTAGNVGGGGFAVVRTRAGKATALDFREVAPAAATEGMYLDEKGNPTNASIVGHKAAGVPGAVAGMWALHQKYGKTKWKELVMPAVALARDGFEVDAYLNRALSDPRSRKRLQAFAATAKIWYPAGEPLATGTKVQIAALAAVLERVATKGPDGFYKGETAAAIVEEMTKGGGIITAKDLETYAPVWRTPLKFPYRGNTVTSMPPPSSGGIVLAMTAGMLRDVEVGKLPWHGKEHVHRLAEVWRRAFAARNELLGDPKFVKAIPVQKLMSAAYQAELAKTIGDKATPSKDVQPLREGSNTTNLCVVDGKGMAVVITTTLNTSFGSGVTIEKGGFLLNNEMDDFTAKPGSPNVFGLVQGVANKIEPGKRPLSSMSPTFVEDAKGNLVVMVGAAGGPRIITSVWQTLSNVVDFRQSAANAVANPRVHHQHLPDVLRIEGGAIEKSVEAALIEAGHQIDWSWDKREFGAVNAIVKTPAGWDGAADPRGGGGAVGD